MRYGKCIGCGKYKKLIIEKMCVSCVEEVKKSFIYGIGGKQVTKETYDRITKRGYLIPEEIEDIRLKEDENGKY